MLCHDINDLFFDVVLHEFINDEEINEEKFYPLTIKKKSPNC